MRDQEAAIAAYAKSRGVAVTRFYREAESGIHEKIERRDQMRALLADVREGDLVLCDKIDRWSRDPEFTYKSIREILAARAAFYAVGDNCDPSTNEGDTMLNFRVLFAKEEHKRIKLRMVGTRLVLRDAGYYTEGMAPFGYRRSLPKGVKGPDKNLLVIVEAEAETVRKIFALSVAGSSLPQIGVAVGLTLDRVRSIVKTRVYLGEVRNRDGVWIRARHAPIIDADTFARAHAGIATRFSGRKASAGSQTKDWILRGLVWCGKCEARCYPRYATAGHYYYSCADRCGARTVPVGKIEALAEALVVARLVELRSLLAKPPPPVARGKGVDVVALRDRLKTKRARVLDTYADGLSTKEELRNALTKLDAEAHRLDAAEASAAKPSRLADVAVRRARLASVDVARAAWAGLLPPQKREVIASLAHAVYLTRDKPPRFEWRTPEEYAQERVG